MLHVPFENSEVLVSIRHDTGTGADAVVVGSQQFSGNESKYSKNRRVHILYMRVANMKLILVN